ncbi:MAG TPA: inositol-3-phosphate synthase [Planctomycetaceae bacterium]|nr:inositol-3-phosphate synthase [Planctomycetaceae bacterium]
MSSRRIGLWLIGAWGRMGTAVAVTLAGLQSRTIAANGLVTEQPEFARLDFADWTSFVLGGHEIRKTSALVEARNLFTDSTTLTAERLAALAPALADWDRNVRTGTLLNSGPEIESRASTATLKTREERPRAALHRVTVDLEEFQKSTDSSHIIVVNIASVEPPMPNEDVLLCGQLLDLLENSVTSPVSTSVLYAVAALQAGHSYLNWTPAKGSSFRALDDLAIAKGALHMGREGRTDLGSLGLLSASDDDEQLRAAKVLLDAARFCEREHRRRTSGWMTFLSCFFQHPIGGRPDDVASHRALLYDWARQVSAAN